MRAFAHLYQTLDGTTRSSGKLAALEAYFQSVPDADAAWAIHFLMGGRVRRCCSPALLRTWAADASGVAAWLVEESYATVGDLAETIALLLETLRPDAAGLVAAAPAPPGLAEVVETWLLPLASLSEEEKRSAVTTAWQRLHGVELFVYNKLLTGGFRVGVARGLVERALAAVAGVEPAVMAHRLAGSWKPEAARVAGLKQGSMGGVDPAQPYPFHLASTLDQPLHELGAPTDWVVEWKWDGVRAQLLRRSGICVLWSRGDELLTDAFPELVRAAELIPDGTVLDGEVLVWKGTRPAPFSDLQHRLGRRQPGGRVQLERPAVFLAYDLLEEGGVDISASGLSERQQRLTGLLAVAARTWAKRPVPESPAPAPEQLSLFPVEPRSNFAPAPAAEPAASPGAFPIQASEPLSAATWEEVASLRSAARARGVEGLILKRGASPYGTGRHRGDWWKWKTDPFTIDAVLMGAEPGHGRRATLLTDYTFGVWDGATLVTVAKAYSGLTDLELEEMDAWIKAHQVGKFGPVRRVQPEMVFELAFEGIQRSSRHKAGVALRLPRIARWRKDKPASEADTLESLQRLLLSPA